MEEASASGDSDPGARSRGSMGKSVERTKLGKARTKSMDTLCTAEVQYIEQSGLEIDGPGSIYQRHR